MLGRTAARLWVALAIVGLAAVTLIGRPAERSQAKPAATVATIVSLPPGWQLNRMPLGPSRTEVALAPDGSLLVFSATPDGTMAKAMLYKRPLDSREASVIPGTQAGCMPFFSPDGQSDRVLVRREITEGVGQGRSSQPDLQSQGPSHGCQLGGRWRNRLRYSCGRPGSCVGGRRHASGADDRRCQQGGDAPVAAHTPWRKGAALHRDDIPARNGGAGRMAVTRNRPTQDRDRKGG